MISGATRVAAVLGDPIDHSLSPLLHNGAYQALGMDAIYVALRVPLADAAAAFRGVAALGMMGVNVTMPLKARAAEAATRRAPEVEQTGVANTLVNTGGELRAHNTDVDGFVRAARDDLGVELSGVSAVVLGAGGAARAVVAGLVREGAAQVVVAGRRRVPSEKTAAIAGRRGRAIPLGSPVAARLVAHAHLVVNATPLGMREENLPEHVTDALTPSHAVMDLVYAPPDTPLVVAARAAGARATSGMGMLVQQAGLAFTLFTGQPAPLDAMSAAAVARLARS